MTSESTPRRVVLTDAVLEIVATRGLERATVREVAAAAGVSIGTVQHYFPTKDAMLVAAFEVVVARTLERMRAVALGPDVATNLYALTRQMLPLDDERAGDSRVLLAFLARCAVDPQLARVESRLLGEHLAMLGAVFEEVGLGVDEASTAALVLLSAVDGLALHAVTSAGALDESRLSTALERLVAGLVGPVGP